RRAIEETLPTLPQELGGGPVTVLTRGITWAALGADVTPKLAVRLTVQSQDAEAAKKLADWYAWAVVKLVNSLPEAKQAWPDLEPLVAKAAPKVEGDRLTLALDEATVTAAVQPGVVKVRAAAERAETANKLKQIGIAMHNYLDNKKTFPAAANYDKAGKPLLSWRVHLLPYIEEGELYKKFKLDEPWDSEHNKKLLAQMPAVYRTSKNLEAGKTTFLGVAGESAMFPRGRGVAIREITDGLSNTIFVVDADEAKAVAWT